MEGNDTWRGILIFINILIHKWHNGNLLSGCPINLCCTEVQHKFMGQLWPPLPSPPAHVITMHSRHSLMTFKIVHKQSLCGIHIFIKILIHWNQYRGLQQKYEQNLWNLMITAVEISFVFTHFIREEVILIMYKLVYGLFAFSNCPVTTSTAHSYQTCSKQ